MSNSGRHNLEPFVHDGGPTHEALFAFVAGRLHPEAAGWIGSHVDKCGRCRETMARITSVRDALEPPAEQPFARQAAISAVKKRLEHRPMPWSRIAMGTLVGMAAGIALVMTLHHRPSAVADREVGATLVAQEGVAQISTGMSQHAAAANDTLPVGGALTVAADARAVVHWGGATVAVEGGANGARVQLVASSEKRRELVLDRGRVVLDVSPMKVGAELAVRTLEARVTVHGTRFLVEESPAGTAVAVDRGLVRVQGARVVDVAAGQRLAAGATDLSPLDAADAARLQAIDRLIDLRAATAQPTPPAAIAPQPATAAASVAIEEPVRAHAKHANVKEAAPNAQDALAAARADVLAGHYDRAIERLDDLSLVRGVPPVQRDRALLLEAQAERLARRPDRALPLYDRVAHGSGPEAEQAAFMLGQTLARDLGDPSRAAGAFAESQRRFPRGIFAEESSFRRGEALLHAGEPRAAADTLARYLAQFPSAPHADDARFYIAQALEKSGDKDSARVAYQRYLAAQPHGKFAAEARAAVGQANATR